MILLESGRVGVFVMVLGDERACDFVWTIHQSTPAEQRSEYSAWRDEDVSFRVVNDGIKLDGRALSFFLHGSSHVEWGAPSLADVVIAAGECEGAFDVPMIRADDFERPFDAWKHALKLALTRLRGTEVVPAQPSPREDIAAAMLDIGGSAIERWPDMDPLMALTRCKRSPGSAGNCVNTAGRLADSFRQSLFWDKSK